MPNTEIKSPEAEALERVKSVLILEGYNDNSGLKDIAILEGCVRASELLRIIFDAPYIIETLFNKNELGKMATQRYLWGTVSNEDVQKVKEFFSDEKH